MNEHQLAAFGLPIRPMHSGSRQLAASRAAAHRSGLLQALRARRLALQANRTTASGQELDRSRYTTAI